MEKLFIQTFDAIKIGEEAKQKIKDRLTEYQNNLVLGKNQKGRKKFQWNVKRVAIAASTAVVLLFCAIFFPIMAFNGRGGEQDMTAVYKTELLAALNQLRIVDSYVETVETYIITNQNTTNIKYTTKYQKSGNAYIAEGLMENNATSQKFYYADYYMYMPTLEDEGIKIRLEEELTSMCQYFSKNSGYLSTEIINSLSVNSDISTQKINGQTVYTFKARVIEDVYTTNSNYTVTVDASQRITAIRQVGSMLINEDVTTIELTASYNYIAIEVELPNNLDKYSEYKG